MKLKISAVILVVAGNLYAKPPFCPPDPAGLDWDTPEAARCAPVYDVGTAQSDASVTRKAAILKEIENNAKLAYSHLILATGILSDDVIKTNRTPCCIGAPALGGAGSRRHGPFGGSNCHVTEMKVLTSNQDLVRERVTFFQNEMESFRTHLGVVMNRLVDYRREFGVSVPDKVTVGTMDSALQVVYRDSQLIKVSLEKLAQMGDTELNNLVLGAVDESVDPVVLPVRSLDTGDNVIIIARKGPSISSVLNSPQLRFLREAVAFLSQGDLERRLGRSTTDPRHSQTPAPGAVWPHAEMFDSDPCHVMTPGCSYHGGHGPGF